MKNKIWQKYFICLGIVLVAVGLIVNVIGRIHSNKAFLKEHRETLYRECRVLSNEYVKEVQNANLNREQYRMQLLSVKEMLKADIWAVDNSGNILVATEPKAEGKTVPEDVLAENWSSKLKMPDVYSGERLLVVDPVIVNIEQNGYIVISEPMSNIRADVKEMMLHINIIAAAFLLLGTGIFTAFARYHTKNVEIIKNAVVHYTDGDFSQEMNVKSRDEYWDLANSVHLLADQHANLVEYQKNFIANISHDFRSPLTSIKGYAEAMKDGTIPYEIQGKYLNIILFEADRLANLTNDLLDLSNFENKGVHLNFSQFDITKMLKQSAMTFEGKCSQKNLKIRLAFPENTLVVYADKGKIQQVVHNLLDNAIKFSHPDGIIYVSVTERRDKVLVSVRDTGIGIPKESINKVWERFYKTDLSRGKDKKGTGLGLSITKQIIAAHNENIKVSSTEGVGTEFVFSLAKVES